MIRLAGDAGVSTRSSAISVATRLLVAFSAIAAATILGSTAPPYVRLSALAAAAAGLACGFLPRRIARGVIAVILVATYVTPAAFRVLVGHNYFAYVQVWLAGLLGVLVSACPRQGWRLPARWAWPLITWALIIAVTWPIVALRELDFALANFWEYRLPVAGVKLSGRGSVEWIAYNALGQLAGILFLDWLFRQYENRREQFLREVASPLSTALLLACGVGLYQGLVDLNFASGHVWPSVRRAAGTLMDANVFGMLAALWAPVFLMLVFTMRSRWAQAGMVGALLLSLAGVWTSGSRGAALAAALGFSLAASTVLVKLRSSKARLRLALGLSGGAIALFLTIAFVPSLTETAVARAKYLIPDPSLASVRQSLEQLWARDGYGTTATGMIRLYPILGTGIGSFNALVHDYALPIATIWLPGDNAQNWFRHQLAELGLLGSIGWITWVLVFAVALWPRRGVETGPGAALRGPLVGFATASLFGMPGQDPAIVITFWLLVFWFAIDTGVRPGGTNALSGKAWLAMLVIVAVYAVLRPGPDELRPPFRAARFGFPYTYGFDFKLPEHASTRKHGVTVLTATDNYMRLTYWVEHPDADQRRVQVDIWRDDERVVHRRMSRGIPLTEYVPVTSGKRFVLEAEVDRTFTIDEVPRGLTLEWEFVPDAPERQR